MTPTQPSAPPLPALPTPNQPIEAQPLTLDDLLRNLLNQKWVILAATLLCLVATLTYALITPRLYQSEILLEPVSEDGKKGGGTLAQLGGLAAMAGLSMGSGDTSKEAALAKLKSRIFIGEFIQDEKLLPVLFSDQWDASKQEWHDSTRPPTLFKGVTLFKTQILKISEEKKSGLITLSVEWTDREQTARWANLLVERINLYLRTLAIEDTKRNMEYLNKELAKTTIVELKQVIASLLENQIKKVMLANRHHEYAFKVLDPAVVPELPIWPKRTQIVLIGVMGGILLGILLAFVRISLQNRKKIAL
ncbi:MAG: hypothetical protein HQL99_02515 [Magnetococcales bacterium]|nr:hypothetical protein [Magnetococcales bacterium]